MSECEGMIERINAVEGCADTKRRVLDVLLREMAVRGAVSGARSILRTRQRQRILGVAVELLRSHTTRGAAQVLRERFGISPRTAQRCVAQARCALREATP